MPPSCNYKWETCGIVIKARISELAVDAVSINGKFAKIINFLIYN